MPAAHSAKTHPAKEPEEKDPGLVTTRVEKKQLEEHAPVAANVIYETIRREGDDELRRPSSALAWSGLACGLSMGASLLAEGFLTAHLPNASWTPLVTKLGYSVGFLIVILGKQQLFTENTLTVILPLLLRRRMETLLHVLRLWGIVLASNLVGTYLFALTMARTSLFGAPIQHALLEVSQDGVGAPFHLVLLRAIFAGWLIALMVWLLPGADSGRIGIIILITWLIGVGGFNHVVAGSTKMFFLVASGGESWSTYFSGFLLPSLIGNILGGVALVAFLSHAQVTSGEEA